MEPLNISGDDSISETQPTLNEGVVSSKEMSAPENEVISQTEVFEALDLQTSKTEALKSEDVEAEMLDDEDYDPAAVALEMSLAELVDESLQELGNPLCEDKIIYEVLIECGGLTGFMIRRIMEDQLYYGYIKWKVGHAAPRGFWGKLEMKLGAQRVCCCLVRLPSSYI